MSHSEIEKKGVMGMNGAPMAEDEEQGEQNIRVRGRAKRREFWVVRWGPGDKDNKRITFAIQR